MTKQARLSQVESGYKDRLEKEVSTKQQLEKVIMRPLTSVALSIIYVNTCCLALVFILVASFSTYIDGV